MGLKWGRKRKKQGGTLEDFLRGRGIEPEPWQVEASGYLAAIEKAGHLSIAEEGRLKLKVMVRSIYDELRSQGREPDEAWIKKELADSGVFV